MAVLTHRLLVFFYVKFIVIRLISGSEVVELNPQSFDSMVNGSPYTWIVQFYSPTCPYCQALVPEYNLAANKLQNSNIKVARINAVEYDDFASRYNVHGYPTIKLFGPGDRTPVDYHGPRLSDDMIAAAKSVSQGKRVRSYGDEDVEPQVIKNTGVRRGPVSSIKSFWKYVSLWTAAITSNSLKVNGAVNVSTIPN